MDPDLTARMRRLVWVHAGRKRTMLVLSWRGSFYISGNMSVTIVTEEHFTVTHVVNTNVVKAVMAVQAVQACKYKFNSNIFLLSLKSEF
jgi:hypothetical protein